MNQQLPLAPAADRSAPPPLLQAARRLVDRLASGAALSASAVSRVMTEAHGGSDAAGMWRWRQAYDACEAASIVAMRRAAVGEARRNPAALLAIAREISGRTPSQTRRSERQTRLSQFSTPLPYAVVAAVAAAPRADELALEPSCGTGLLACGLKIAGCRVILNELDADRRLLAAAAHGGPVSGHDAEFIDDLLPGMQRPTLVVMNPPFSATAARTGDSGVAGAHLISALKRLEPGGRLVAIMPEGFGPNGSGRDAFAQASARATLRMRLTIGGEVYARHGARVTTTLAVFDKAPDDAAPIVAAPILAEPSDLDAALALALTLPPRPDGGEASPAIAGLTPSAPPAARPRAACRPQTPGAATPGLFAVRREPGQPLVYSLRDSAADAGAATADGLYAGYQLARLDIPEAQPHPTPLVQSAAMAAIAPPAAAYAPMLPPSLVRRGILSDAQLETIVYAGEAFSQDLPGAVLIDDDWRVGAPCAETEPGAARLRRGFFLGDGTGCGKGREVAGVILGQWLRKNTRAVWVSKSDKLIEDAIRDWTALGGDAGDIRPLAKWKLGEPIAMDAGILFVTYATLRVGPRQGKTGRLEQIVDWLGRDFEGVIAFDESHAMGGAAGSKSDRGAKKGSLQGVAGLRLQLAAPRARVLYVSATGATTVENLAYASRLGLWGVGDYPFQSREEFMTAMEAGGVAAMEIVARDLKALGLYIARALSFEGVEYDILEHALTPEQRAIYDAYADAFQVIHTRLDEAMKITNVTSEDGCNDSAAKSAMRSRFESLKQRFFNHLLLGMKTPAMLDAIVADLASGDSVVVQIVSTGEALMERRLDAIAPGEHDDLSIDLTPREYVVEYLRDAFPTEIRQVFEDENGNSYTEVLRDENGRALESREACAMRDAMIEQLCLMAPVQTALDQIVWRLSADAVAEATGRGRRVIPVDDARGRRLRVERRSASANTAETLAFMEGRKRLLVFSEAGGTGRSYHADRGAANQQRRIHYLLEAGWKADTAVQGLGRTHRSNQASAPLFRPVTTDVKAERRFISTIARRLDSLGALTRGAARTGGQNLFRPEDNLESRFAKAALRSLYAAIASGAAESISLEDFVAKTGLELVADDGALLEELPPITRFLNRLLALRISDQDAIFEEFMTIIEGRMEAAAAAGQLHGGVETLAADRIEALDRTVLRTCPATGSQTLVWRLAVEKRVQRFTAAEMRRRLDGDPEMVRNNRSGHVAFRTDWASFYDDDGAIERQVRLVRPRGREVMKLVDLINGHWEPCDRETFDRLWDEAVAALPEMETEEIALVSGLILPIWKHLPTEAPMIRRLTTACGENLIGRIVPLDRLQQIAGALAPIDVADPRRIAQAVMIEGHAVELVHGVQLKRRIVAGHPRLEIENVPGSMVPALKAAGAYVEIIQYSGRVFVPMTKDLSDAHVAVLAAVLELLPPFERD